jgi:hypothetical protein
MKEYKYSEAVTVRLGKVDFRPTPCRMLEIDAVHNLEIPATAGGEYGTPVRIATNGQLLPLPHNSSPAAQ